MLTVSSKVMDWPGKGQPQGEEASLFAECDLSAVPSSVVAVLSHETNSRCENVFNNKWHLLNENKLMVNLCVYFPKPFL